jgi:hypothetical protein
MKERFADSNRLINTSPLVRHLDRQGITRSRDGCRHGFWAGLVDQLALYHRLLRHAFLAGSARVGDLAVLFGRGLALADIDNINLR